MMWRSLINKALADAQFRQQIDLLDEELSAAFLEWQRWEGRLKRFTALPPWKRWLMGGWLMRTILNWAAEAAEIQYWSIEIQYH